MTNPKITRPKFPKGYVDKPASFLTWEWVAAQLTESKHYWLCSVRPPSSDAQGGRPHVVPRWGAFLDNKFYYDGSPETRHAHNIVHNPHVTLNTPHWDIPPNRINGMKADCSCSPHVNASRGQNSQTTPPSLSSSKSWK
jgi:hypothetical protein